MNISTSIGQEIGDNFVAGLTPDSNKIICARCGNQAEPGKSQFVGIASDFLSMMNGSGRSRIGSETLIASLRMVFFL